MLVLPLVNWWFAVLKDIRRLKNSPLFWRNKSSKKCIKTPDFSLLNFEVFSKRKTWYFPHFSAGCSFCTPGLLNQAAFCGSWICKNFWIRIWMWLNICYCRKPKLNRFCWDLGFRSKIQSWSEVRKAFPVWAVAVCIITLERGTSVHSTVCKFFFVFCWRRNHYYYKHSIHARGIN